ncbi:hypothetical protein HELRODRAFT_106779 [Helobdella robusta]|uniref:Fringe-like glycosyltransferase domain-containing protein n=1 Tax=Helobdella robusta TaxID=6412 RepID=T1EE49_HELRO|nr:hypothetical protein HELRODRAFT_106779 [Helobdella robusta]ESO02626.1 hypothetical protein HELRODRAFT_106779 [Helobdella robusta]
MAVSRAGLFKLIDSRACYCNRDDSPDDMTLGSCLALLNIRISHDSRFHQAQPRDYHPSLLKYRRPISFHRHYSQDNFAVYDKYLKDDDGDDDGGDDDFDDGFYGHSDNTADVIGNGVVDDDDDNVDDSDGDDGRDDVDNDDDDDNDDVGSFDDDDDDDDGWDKNDNDDEVYDDRSDEFLIKSEL